MLAPLEKETLTSPWMVSWPSNVNRQHQLLQARDFTNHRGATGQSRSAMFWLMLPMLQKKHDRAPDNQT
jgi:hypothetical protein